MGERAFEPRQTALQKDEARSGELGGGLEIHLPKRFTEIEMLLGIKTKIVLRTEVMVFDVVVRVLAVRNVLAG